MSKFNFEIILSTDGKHSVWAKGEDEAAQDALKWAKETYDDILKTYGTKQAQAVKAYAKKEGFPDDTGPIAQTGQEGVPICPKHHKPMTQGKWGWYCKTPDDSQPKGWCTYKPPGADKWS